MDEKTSLLVLIPAGIGSLIEVSIHFILAHVKGKVSSLGSTALGPKWPTHTYSSVNAV